MLASLIINHLEAEQTESKTSYFYCRQNDETEGEAQFLSICKSLLTQLITHNRDLLPTLHDKRMTGSEVLDNEGTAKTLLELFGEADMKQFIVIDGLDELGHVQRKNLLHTLSSIVGRSDVYKPGKIRLLLISAPLADMKTKLIQPSEKVDFYDLLPRSTQKDIKCYLTRNVQVLQEQFSLSHEDVTRVLNSVYNNAEGKQATYV